MEEDSAPPLPGGADEAAFLAEANGEAAAVIAAPVETEEGRTDELPPLEELAGRVPPAVRARLDELFRARFTGVKRAAEADLAAQTSK
jgi:hypothetical protein